MQLIGVFRDRFERRPKHITVALQRGKTGHEISRLFDDVAPLGQCLTRRMTLVANFSVVNGVRLLPDQERADAGRGIVAIRANHFGPPHAIISLPSSNLLGDRKDALIEIEGAFKEREPIPGSEVNAMPPVHFEMGFAIPGVKEKPGFGRRHGPGAVEGGVVRREDNATFSSSIVRAGRSRRRGR